MDEGRQYMNLPAYSYSLCMMKCRQKYAIRLCGCSPPFYYHFNIAGNRYSFPNTESSIYYARLQTADARDHDWPARRLTERHTAAAPKHSLCFSVTVIPVTL